MLSRLLAAATLLMGTLAPAAAASISIRSMQYSAAQPVPHIHYEGETLPGDVEALRGVFENFVKCRLECLGPSGASTAVLTMNGPGGAYFEGLALADFLRENHIASVVERGAGCYSACAFAFLGGSGYSSMDGFGTYIDRQIEPGGIVGFHSPYRDEASFLQALEQRGADELMTENRDALSRMVKELVKWNVDPEIIHYMLGKGPNQTYDVVGADDYYLVRAALPPTPAAGWAVDLKTAVKHVCMRLMAIAERADPLNYRSFFDLLIWQDNLGVDDRGRMISGYHWNDRLLDIGSCGLPDAASGITADMEISLYFTPGVTGTIAADTTFNFKEQGWSTAGRGHNPVKRILQKGPMNHYWLPVGVTVDSLELPGEFDILKNRFFTEFPPAFATMDPSLVVTNATQTRRISNAGNVWVFEQTGPRLLFESAVADPGTGLNLINNGGNDFGFIRQGTYPDGTPFSIFGFANGDAATVIHALIVNPGGTPATPEQADLLLPIQCSAEFQGLKLGGCG